MIEQTLAEPLQIYAEAVRETARLCEWLAKHIGNIGRRSEQPRAKKATEQLKQRILWQKEQRRSSCRASRANRWRKPSVFATEQREVLFSKRRSMETTHGVIGFRTGNPQLKPRRGFTWAAALELVREFLPSYIRTEEAIAKDKLLADRENEEIAPLMEKCGIIVGQAETFYVEPKKEKED